MRIYTRFYENSKIKYSRNIKISVILILSLVIAAFKLTPPPGEINSVPIEIKKRDPFTQIPLTNLEDKKPQRPHSKPSKLMPISTMNTYTPEDIVNIKDPGLDSNQITTQQTFAPVSDNDQDFLIFVPDGTLPEPVGGIEEIQRKIVYPKIAVRGNIEGQVIVRAFVDENGDVIKTELLKGIGAGCDQVSLEAVKQTKFNPGMQRGKPVRVQVSIPIFFKLQK